MLNVLIGNKIELRNIKDQDFSSIKSKILMLETSTVKQFFIFFVFYSRYTFTVKFFI